MKKFLCCFLAAVITIACMAAVWFCSAQYTKNKIIREQRLYVKNGYINCEIGDQLYLYYYNP